MFPPLSSFLFGLVACSQPMDSSTALEHPDRDEDEDSGDRAGEHDSDVLELVDDAVVVSATLPASLTCGNVSSASVQVRNTGTTTWTEEEGYKLGTVDDSDPFFEGTRVYLADGTTVPPGEVYTFEFELEAPGGESTELTDWQMVNEDVRWFGETTSQEIEVACDAVHVSDPLTDGSLRTGFADKQVEGGSFSSSGWQATGGWDQIELTLDDPVHTACQVSIDVWNFDPHTQYSGSKHQIFSMYTSTDGSQAVFETNEAWWNIRTGSNYGTGFKFLASANGGAEREEVRIMEDATWDPDELHTFSVAWDANDIRVYLDGTELERLDFDGRESGLQTLFIGRDNVYDGQAGPVYQNLQIDCE